MKRNIEDHRRERAVNSKLGRAGIHPGCFRKSGKYRAIRDAVSAEYGPVPLEMVAEYLRALEKIGVVEEKK